MRQSFIVLPHFESEGWQNEPDLQQDEEDLPHFQEELPQNEFEVPPLVLDEWRLQRELPHFEDALPPVEREARPFADPSLNVPEFGSAKTEDGFRGHSAMDPYSHVKDGEKYPAVLLTTGATDPRVAPWQVTKMAAPLQAATASGRPVLLRVDYDAGHGLGSTASQRDEELADEEAFLLSQFGEK